MIEQFEASSAMTPPERWPWCIVMSEGRTFSRGGLQVQSPYWHFTAAINAQYAQRHEYSFSLIQPTENRCPHLVYGRRAAAWCKIAAVAGALIHGIDGRPCGSVLYMDSDAVVSNGSLSIDQWLERARDERRDEALVDDEWLLLFSSNYWFGPDELNSGVFLARGSQHASHTCGLLRRWWDSFFPTYNMNRPWEQGALNAMYLSMHGPHARDGRRRTADARVALSTTAWADRIRLLPTARFYRRHDMQWKPPRPGSWQALVAGSQYSEDDFIHHGARSIDAANLAWRGVAWRHGDARRSVINLPAPLARRIEIPVLCGIFNASADLDERCPRAEPSAGTPAGFDDERRYRRVAMGRRNQSHVRLNGQTVREPRPCWGPIHSSYVQAMMEWKC